MKIGGLQKMTLIDYPSKIAATVFLCGCNFRCSYCQNPELIENKNPTQIPHQDFFDFLKSRQGMIDGVCITGGEPTINSNLPALIKKIKKLGFLVKLDTNGSNPQMLKELYENKLLDYIAMDIKASKEKYLQVASVILTPAISRGKDPAQKQSENLLKNIQQSIDLIRNSAIDYEFRTTIAPGIIDEAEIKKIGQWLKGSRLYALQQFRSEKTLDKSWQAVAPYSEQKLKHLAQIARPYFERVELRGLK